MQPATALPEPSAPETHGRTRPHRALAAVFAVVVTAALAAWIVASPGAVPPPAPGAVAIPALGPAAFGAAALLTGIGAALLRFVGRRSSAAADARAAAAPETPSTGRRDDASGRPAPGSGEVAPPVELALLAVRCRLPLGEDVDAVLDAAARHHQVVRPDPTLRDDDGLPVMTARIAALDAVESLTAAEATTPTRRALAALERPLRSMLRAAAEVDLAGTPPTVVLALAPATSSADREAALRWAQRTGVASSPPEVVAVDAPALWRLAADRCAASRGRTVVLAAAHSDVAPAATARLQAGRRLHGRDCPAGAMPGEGAVVLALRAAPGDGDADGEVRAERPADASAAPARFRLARLVVVPGQTARRPDGSTAPRAAGAAAAGEPPSRPRPSGPGPDGDAPPDPVIAAAIDAALTTVGIGPGDVADWFTDAQPHAEAADAVWSAVADAELEPSPMAFALGRCGTLGIAGALAAPALAAARAAAGGRHALAITTSGSPLAVVALAADGGVAQATGATR